MEQGRNRPENMTEHSAEAREIDAVLGLASVPGVPAGAMERLMARIAVEPQQPLAAEVIAFAPRPRLRTGLLRFAAAVPLAASLALGVYLGAEGKMDFMMPSAITGGMALNDDVLIDDLGGVGDADAFAREGMT